VKGAARLRATSGLLLAARPLWLCNAIAGPSAGIVVEEVVPVSRVTKAGIAPEM